jgi:hypothetical protein
MSGKVAAMGADSRDVISKTVAQHPLTPRQIADLQEEVERAGAATRMIRFAIIAGVVIWKIYAVMTTRIYLYHEVDDSVEYVARLAAVPCAALFGALFATAVAVLVGWVYRWIRARQLRLRLARLPAGEQGKVLFAFCGAEGDTGRIADRLITEMRLERRPGEVTPAEAPEGRGTEVSVRD